MRVKRAFWNIKNIPLTLLTFFTCYPFAVLFDLFRNGDILFVNPKALKERMKKKRNVEKQQIEDDLENRGCLDYFRNRMHISLFRIIPDFFIQKSYLIVLCLAIWSSVDPVEANFQDSKFV